MTIQYLLRAVTFSLLISQSLISQPIKIGNTNTYKRISNEKAYFVENQVFNPKNLYNKEEFNGSMICLNKNAFPHLQHTKTEWVSHSNYSSEYTGLFRKEFELLEVPDDIFLSISADVSFSLFINGEFVTKGPHNIGSDYEDKKVPEHWYFTTHNIKPYLKSGKNLIAVEVFGFAREISETTTKNHWLICDVETGDGKFLFGTDKSWICTADTSLKIKNGHFQKNGNSSVNEWYKENAKVEHWKNASSAKIDHLELIRSNIPSPLFIELNPEIIFGSTKTDIKGLYEKKLFNENISIDFGRNLTFSYHLMLLANKGDSIIITPYEKEPTKGNRRLLYICNENENYIELPTLAVGRYCNLEIKSKYGITFKKINFNFSSYPLKLSGSFSCSDPFLTSLWKTVVNTAQLCMYDMYFDSPKHQEPNACTGDYLIESLISYYAFGDSYLARQTLQKTSLMLKKNNYDMFHTSYSLLWVQMMMEYYKYTKDKTFIIEEVEHVNNLLSLFETYMDDKFLLSQCPDYMFMDWIKIDNFNAHHPPAEIGMGYITAFYYKALLDAVSLNEIAGNPDKASSLKLLSEKIKSGLNENLWDEKKNLYKDGISFLSKMPNHFFFPADINTTTYSPHINCLMVLYDIAPKEKHNALLNYVLNQTNTDIQPYFSYFVLSALSKAGLFNNLGVKFIGKWANGYDKVTKTLKENWQDVTETGYGGDYSHAWGGSPLIFMHKDILGVEFSLNPNYNFEINPYKGKDILWAKGQVEAIDGKNLKTYWKKSASGRINYTFKLSNKQATIVINRKSILNEILKTKSKYLIEGDYFVFKGSRIKITL